MVYRRSAIAVATFPAIAIIIIVVVVVDVFCFWAWLCNCCCCCSGSCHRSQLHMVFEIACVDIAGNKYKNNIKCDEMKCAFLVQPASTAWLGVVHKCRLLGEFVRRLYINS